jgi:hypothetical protein
MLVALKSENRKPKSEANPKSEMRKNGSEPILFRVLFVWSGSDFVRLFRISDFGFRVWSAFAGPMFARCWHQVISSSEWLSL